MENNEENQNNHKNENNGSFSNDNNQMLKIIISDLIITLSQIVT